MPDKPTTSQKIFAAISAEAQRLADDGCVHVGEALLDFLDTASDADLVKFRDAVVGAVK